MRVTIKHSPTRRQLGVVSSIAAPLLAAAAVTVIAVIIQVSDSLALPTVALTALTLATAALIISISSIWAAYCDGEPHGETTTSVSAPDMNDNEYWKAVDAFQAYRFWVKITRISYLLGVYALWAGIAFALIPKPFDPWRLIAIVPVVVGMLAELGLHRIAPKTQSEATHWVEGH